MRPSPYGGSVTIRSARRQSGIKSDSLSTLRAPPGACYFVNGRRYDATPAGEVHVESERRNDLTALLNAGCVADAPWFHSVPPASPAPARPAPRTVRLRARPHSVWQPATGARYTADAEGFLDVAPEHAAALLREGRSCAVRMRVAAIPSAPMLLIPIR